LAWRKKRALRKEMEGISIQIQVVAAIAITGALVETFIPGLITEKLKTDLSAITIAVLGILFSFLLLMVLLKVRIREGFEDTDLIRKWDTLLSSNQMKDVCDTYTEMYERMVTVEKGAPPDQQKTDAQAREVVDKHYSSRMSVSPLSCAQVEEIRNAKTIDSLYLLIPKVPDTLLIQNYETANACRSLLIDNYLKLQDAENKRKEGFQDIVLCTDKEAEERRAFVERKPLSDEAQKCMLLEEIPGEKKREVIEKKLNTIQVTYDLYTKQKSFKDPLSKVLKDCTYYKEKLNEKKKEAEETSNKYNW
jgi:hypothetical protein